MNARTLLLLPLCLITVAAIEGCGSTSLNTAGLARVAMSSSQALPPPYGSKQATLTAASSIATFQQQVASHHIGLAASSTSGGGCTGGIQYTIVLEWGGGKPSTTLSAYDCANQITGNMSGDVAGFLAYVNTQLTPTSSGE